MLTPQHLSEAFARNVMILQRQAAGLSQADSLRQPPVRGNCLNWLLGHLVDNRNTILGLVDEAPTTDPALIARYLRESEPIVADGEGVLPLAELLAALERSQERLGTRLSTMTEDELASERLFFGQRSHPIANSLFFLYFHESYHTGQAELLRQLAGTDDKII